MSKINVNVKTRGFDELRKKLRELPRRVENRVLLQSLKTGARPINRAIKSLAPVASPEQTTRGVNIAMGGGRGLLKKSIGIRGKMKRNKSQAYVLVGPRRKQFRTIIGSDKKGKQVVMNPTNYAHLQERGHTIKIHGRIVARNPGTKFMEKGTSQATSAAQAAVESKMAQGIAREAAKA